MRPGTRRRGRADGSPGRERDDGSSGDDHEPADDLPRVDEPAYEIAEPACGDDGDRDPLWLCENTNSEPSLAFDQVETSASVLADEGLGREVDEEDAPSSTQRC